MVRRSRSFGLSARWAAMRSGAFQVVRALSAKGAGRVSIRVMIAHRQDGVGGFSRRR